MSDNDNMILAQNPDLVKHMNEEMILDQSPDDENMVSDIDESIQQMMITGQMPSRNIKPNAFIRKTKTLVKDNKINRNDECLCGSGKKYKKCCMRTHKYEGYHEI